MSRTRSAPHPYQAVVAAVRFWCCLSARYGERVVDEANIDFGAVDGEWRSISCKRQVGAVSTQSCASKSRLVTVATGSDKTLAMLSAGSLEEK
jgi:DNA-binding transcriptional regulator LsrR (DeoR family)